jgi:hypothetical protein
MPQKSRNQHALEGLVLVILLAIFVSGCAIGTTRVQINHETLDRVENKKTGNILVKEFVDKRKDTQHIGNKRNGFGMVLGSIGTEEGVKLETLLTKYFAEAIREAGYNTYIQGTQPGQAIIDAIVDGEIVEFWLDLYMKVWHNTEVKLRALNPVSQTVLWEKDLKSDQSNVLWIGATEEFEKVISESLTKALNQAAKEFASDEFYGTLKK